MLVEAILVLCALFVLMPVAVLTVQVLAALPSGRPAEMPAGRRPSIVVLVPAHNEALMIVHTLRSVMGHLTPGDRLLVVADNCSDDTARIAAAAGAEVVERFNRELRGKIHALDFGIRHLEKAPPEVVMIVDADCEVGSGAIERLGRACLQTDRPVQGLYLMTAPVGAGLRLRIAEFAWAMKNHVRATGARRLGLPCQLMGSGMAFPWRFISRVSLSGGYIAEDYKLGLDLTRMGAPPLFCPDARVTSQFPSNAEGIAGQRKRWEHGHIALILGQMPSLLLEAIKNRNLPLLGLTLDLGVPPLALLLLMTLAVEAASIVFYLVTGTTLTLYLSTAACILLGVAVFTAWVRYSRHILSLQDLVYAPVYAMRKIPLYLKYFVSRQVEWVRSRRDGE